MTDINNDNTIYSTTFALLYNKPVITEELLSTQIQPKTYTYKFIAHELSFTDFKTIFYSGDMGIYNMNEMYKNTPYLNFDIQEVSSKDGKYSSNTLFEYILAAYENLTSTSRDNMNPLSLMRLEKDILQYRSLTNICNISVIHNLQDCLELMKNYSKNNNKTNFQLLFTYSNDLFKDIEIIFEFNYLITYDIHI